MMLINQRIVKLILGYKNINDHDEQRQYLVLSIMFVGPSGEA
ncbi:transposase [Acetobacter pomorum]|nr:transposase [Acetobacter pomorum]